jgi:hypothetical protein
MGKPCIRVKLPFCGARNSITCTRIIGAKFSQVAQLYTPRDRSIASCFGNAVFRSLGSQALFSAQMRCLLLERVLSIAISYMFGQKASHTPQSNEATGKDFLSVSGEIFMFL